MEERVGQAKLGLVYAQLIEVEFGDQPWLLWVGDVEDVDVGELHLVLGDEVGICAGVPDEDAMGLVGVATLGLGPIDRPIPKVLGEFDRVERVGDIPQAEAGLVVLSAGFFVHGQDVAGEACRRHVDDLHPLARARVLVHRDKAHFDRIL